jgi:hypothetical protein
MLSACSRYLQWVGLREAGREKPVGASSDPLGTAPHRPAHQVRCGPTLAGLPGGVAGDLMRLYPVQRLEQLPLEAPPPAASLAVLPAAWGPRMSAVLGPAEAAEWGAAVAAGGASRLLAWREGRPVGALVAWGRELLAASKEGPLVAHEAALQELEGVGTLVRLWGHQDCLCWLLQPALLREVLGSAAPSGPALAVSLPSGQHALAVLLRGPGLQLQETARPPPGHALLWGALPQPS